VTQPNSPVPRKPAFKYYFHDFHVILLYLTKHVSGAGGAGGAGGVGGASVIGDTDQPSTKKARI